MSTVGCKQCEDLLARKKSTFETWTMQRTHNYEKGFKNKLARSGERRYKDAYEEAARAFESHQQSHHSR
jgi:hypothetical protein